MLAPAPPHPTARPSRCPLTGTARLPEASQSPLVLKQAVRKPLEAVLRYLGEPAHPNRPRPFTLPPCCPSICHPQLLPTAPVPPWSCPHGLLSWRPQPGFQPPSPRAPAVSGGLGFLRALSPTSVFCKCLQEGMPLLGGGGRCPNQQLHTGVCGLGTPVTSIAAHLPALATTRPATAAAVGDEAGGLRWGGTRLLRWTQDGFLSPFP